MSNNNNLLTEISALVLATLLVIAGAILLYFGKIGYDSAIFFFISALGLFGFNSAWKAPSPAQQTNLLQLLSQLVNQQASQPLPLPPPTTPAAPAQQQFVQTPMNTASGTYVPPALQFTPIDRHFGDSQIIPAVGQVPRG